jgi:hypothetical protein
VLTATNSRAGPAVSRAGPAWRGPPAAGSSPGDKRAAEVSFVRHQRVARYGVAKAVIPACLSVTASNYDGTCCGFVI